MKISTLLIALVSIFTFSSCLDDDDTTYANFASYVTVTGNSAMGYTFYSDLGCTLIPTTSSVNSVFPYLNKNNYKRAYIAFNVLEEGITELKQGQTYQIELVPNYGANFGIQTYKTIDLYQNPVASDSIASKNDNINNVNATIWASKGYLTTAVNISYDINKPFYFNTFYNSNDENYINPTSNTLYLDLYFNNNTEQTTITGSGAICFKLPEEVTNYFKEDSVNLVLRAKSNGYNEFREVAKCKVAIKDFHTPIF